MQIKNVRVYGLADSILRSGYPMQVGEPECMNELTADFILQKSDFKRAAKLANTQNGSGHNNFLKGIIVQFDLQYPEYFSPQLQRYNFVDIISSQSKMHRITSRMLNIDDFTQDTFDSNIDEMNYLISKYNACDSSERKDILFKQIMSNLPSGYLKWMGISTNYLQLKTIYSQRKTHRLSEWREFCQWIETLPMSELITNNK